MNKKCVLALLVALTMSTITGCGLAGKVAKTVMENETTVIAETTTEGEMTETEETTEETAEEETSEEESAERLTGTPILGDTDISYDGYAYLEQIDIENEDGEDITVFIPIDDYNYVDDTSADASAMGVSFDVNADPYLQYNAKDYTIQENMQYMLDSAYDPFYYPENRDLTFSEFEGDDTYAKCDVSYIKKEYDGEYHTYYATYYLMETKKNSYISVMVEISKDDVTGKTPALIAELESFYQFDINWDEEEAQAKEDAFLADPSAFPNTYSVSGLLFELPSEWDQDSGYGEYDEYYFAPDGDMSTANTFVEITYNYTSDAEATMGALLTDPKQAEELLKTSYGDMVDTISASNIGETSLGKTIKVEMTVSEDEESVDMEQYIGQVDGTLYVITVGSYQGDEEGFSVAADILENAQTRKY